MPYWSGHMFDRQNGRQRSESPSKFSQTHMTERRPHIQQSCSDLVCTQTHLGSILYLGHQLHPVASVSESQCFSELHNNIEAKWLFMKQASFTILVDTITPENTEASGDFFNQANYKTIDFYYQEVPWYLAPFFPTTNWTCSNVVPLEKLSECGTFGC